MNVISTRLVQSSENQSHMRNHRTPYIIYCMYLLILEITLALIAENIYYSIVM